MRLIAFDALEPLQVATLMGLLFGKIEVTQSFLDPLRIAFKFKNGRVESV